MYSEKLENLIKGALADGVLEERELRVLRRKAEEEGVDPDELQMDVEARLSEMKSAETKSSAKPKVEKVGIVKKCPKCGAVLTGTEAKCPECGLAFTGIEANQSLQKFTDGLHRLLEKEDSNQNVDSEQRYHSNEKINEYIRSYPIPNSAEDLYAFLSYLLPVVKFTCNSPYRFAYKSKFDECRVKIMQSFPNDKRFTYILDEYEKDEKNLNRLLWYFLAFFVGLIIIAIIAINLK